MHSNISFTEQTRELFKSKGEKTNMHIEACYIQIKHLCIKSADQTLKCSAWGGRKFSHDLLSLLKFGAQILSIIA